MHRFDPAGRGRRLLAAFLLTVLVTALVSCRGEEAPPAGGAVAPPPTAYYDLAAETGEWIRDQVINTPRGTIWPDDASDPDSASIGLGIGVAGTYSFEVAETRAEKTMQMARDNEFPLKCTVEPV